MTDSKQYGFSENLLRAYAEAVWIDGRAMASVPEEMRETVRNMHAERFEKFATETAEAEKEESSLEDDLHVKLENIEREMSAYIEWNPDVFKDKTVLLPCDVPDCSPFTQYFSKNFDRLGMKKLISACHVEGLGDKTVREHEKSHPLFNPDGGAKGKLLVMERSEDGTGNAVQFRYLKGDGDFRSQEVRKLRDEADFIVTCPPPGRLKEFMAWLLDGEKKQFIVAGARRSKPDGKLLSLVMEGNAWQGAANGWFTNVEHLRHACYAAVEQEVTQKDGQTAAGSRTVDLQTLLAHAELPPDEERDVPSSEVSASEQTLLERMQRLSGAKPEPVLPSGPREVDMQTLLEHMQEGNFEEGNASPQR